MNQNWVRPAVQTPATKSRNPLRRRRTSLRPSWRAPPLIRVFDVARYGAVGDGTTLDSPAIQRAIDEAAAYSGKSQVLLRGGKKYLVGTLVLKGAIDFHLADDAQLLASLQREHYLGGLAGSADADSMAAAAGALIVATGAQGLKISGTGTLQGRAREFMLRYDQPNEWWLPKDFRPKMFVLTGAATSKSATSPSPKRPTGVCICSAATASSSTTSKSATCSMCPTATASIPTTAATSRSETATSSAATMASSSKPAAADDYGPAANIHVEDCVIETQDAGLKIGTETTSDIHDIRFERCTIKTSSRGLCIQLRDEGSVYNIDFRDITFVSRYYSDPWWGRGEAISFTAIPRKPGIKTRHSPPHHRAERHRPRREQRPRLGKPRQPRARHPSSTMSTSRSIAGRNTRAASTTTARPSAMAAIEPHDTAGFSIQDADDVTLRDCKLDWGANRPDSFGEAIAGRKISQPDLQASEATSTGRSACRIASIVAKASVRSDSSSGSHMATTII